MDKNEKIILLIIKYTPPFFIMILSIIISFILFENNKKVFEKEKQATQKQFIENNKKYIKGEVERLNAYIRNEQEQTEKKLKENLKNRVNEAYTIAMNIYKENKNLGEKKVTKLIKDALRNIRFNNNRGYFFIYSFDYECILFPIKPEMEGKSFYNFKTNKGFYLTREIVKRLKNKEEGFLTWWYHKPEDLTKHYKKLGFNKYFEPYNWYIGTGEYIKDFEEDVKENVLSHIQNYKYLDSEYFFIIDYRGKYLNHIDNKLIGNSAYKADNIKPEAVKEIIAKAKNNSAGFITYTQTNKPGTKEPAVKTSYVLGVDNWQWIIGKGFYKEDVNKIIEKEEQLINQRLRENLKKLILFTLVLTVVLLLISFYMSAFLKRKFKKYRLQIEKNLEKLTKQQEILAQQSKLAAIGTMIGNIAHQWRQPLSLISTIATGMKLKKEMQDLDEKELFENLDKINDTTQYLSKTIDDFRNFFNSNKVKKEFSVKEAFKNCLNLISVQFKNNDIELIENIEDIKIYGVQTELIQVLINILNNSRDELIKIKDQRRLIFIEAKEEENSLIITIKDNAGGIDEKILDHLFEPYFTTKHQSQGTGIGLYMSEQIIVRHLKGSISMKNCEYDFENKHYKGALTIIKLHLYK
jgi:signal transduction histidine kinase